MVEGPEIENYSDVTEIRYSSDGVLAVPEGTEYSTGEDEFEVAHSDQILTVEEGDEIYVETDAQFAAYDIAEFAKMLSGAVGDTEVWDSDRTKVWSPGKGESGSGDTTKVFDPSDYDIGDPDEYTRMMKENADVIILELADRDVTGEEATETLDQLFESMNDTYDRFIHGTSGKGMEDTELYEENKRDRTEQQEPGKEKLDREDVEEGLEKIEASLEETEEEERSMDDYLDAEKLLHGEQTEIFDFESQDPTPEEGQSEISDW
jgi:hypothetical protein